MSKVHVPGVPGLVTGPVTGSGVGGAGGLPPPPLGLSKIVGNGRVDGGAEGWAGAAGAVGSVGPRGLGGCCGGLLSIVSGGGSARVAGGVGDGAAGEVGIGRVSMP